MLNGAGERQCILLLLLGDCEEVEKKEGWQSFHGWCYNVCSDHQGSCDPRDLSRWHCHYCEPAGSKMAENQVTVVVKWCQWQMCLHSSYAHTHTYTYRFFVSTQSVLPGELLSHIACSKICLSGFSPLIQGNSETPFTNKIQPNLWQCLVNLPSVFIKSLKPKFSYFKILFCSSDPDGCWYGLMEGGYRIWR